MLLVLLKRIISFKEVSVNYKPILEYMKSHCVFISMFESFKLNPCCLFDYVPNYLLVGKLGRLGPRNELRG